MHWILFALLFSFFSCVGLQWCYYLTIQVRVGFVLLVFILKCFMSTFTFYFFIYFNPEIYPCLLYNCLSKLTTHAVKEDKLKTKQIKTKKNKQTNKSIAWLLSHITRLTEMSRARQLPCDLWSKTIFWQKSYQIKRSFKLISLTSSHLFPLRHQQRGPWHFSAIYFRVFKYQFSVSPIWIIWRLFCESSRKYNSFSRRGTVPHKKNMLQKK